MWCVISSRVFAAHADSSPASPHVAKPAAISDDTLLHELLAS